MHFSPDELRPLEIFEGLSDEELVWLCEHGGRVSLARGEHMFERGQPADAMWVVVEGMIQGFEEVGGQWLLVATTQRGEVTGMLPFSRMTHYPRYTVAVEPSQVLRLPAEELPELVHVSWEVGRRLVAQMSDRVRGDVRLEQQGEKMMALGRLSAGLAHELNNPAAAVVRASARIREHRGRSAALVAGMLRHEVGDEAIAILEKLVSGVGASGPAGGDALERSEREEALLDWLEAREVPEAWDVAAALVETGGTPAELDELERAVSPDALADVLLWVSDTVDAERLAREVHASARRISELVASIKTYSHMDRSTAHQPTDVRVGLESTVTMLGHELKRKSIRVERDFDGDVPTVPANEGQLNQVWTNLIANAIDAMDEGGVLTLRARRSDRWLEVEVADDGHGIPDDVRPRIFEPFFTTKEVGHGTGLGLGIARRIVSTHRGHMEIRSRPGGTVVCVRLPVDAHHDAGPDDDSVPASPSGGG